MSEKEEVWINSGPNRIDRRDFLSILLSVGAAGVGALLAVPLVRFALHPVLTKTTEIMLAPIGSLDELSASGEKVTKHVIRVEQRDGWRKVISEKAVYVVRSLDESGAQKIRVLSPICPHLGCPVVWNKSKDQFQCPCHAGTFAVDGSRVSGPPPRSLDELECKVDNGRLMVRYQYFRSLVPNKEVMV